MTKWFDSLYTLTLFIMTKRLYDRGNCFSFTADVLACTPEAKGYAVELDRTAFFPGGGGQAADEGTLGGVVLLGMRETEGRILHITDRPLSVGARIEGVLNAGLRLRRMQNHSGEHIISGLLWREHGLRNVGFHMGSENITLDLDGELDRAALDRIESMANAIVAENLPVSVRYPAPDELASLDYRSKLDFTEDVRIVTIGDEAAPADRCACCAPHVEHTGQIGIIKLLDFIRYKGGIRIHMLCGLDALADYRRRYTAVAAIAQSLSAKQHEIASAVARLETELAAAHARETRLRDRIIELRVSAISPQAAIACFFEDEDFSPNDLRRLVNTALERVPSAIALSGNDTQGYAYVWGSTSLPLRETSHAMHSALGGKGGGSDSMVQGRIPAARAAIEAYLGNL